MSKNVSDDTLAKRLINTVNELQRQVKALRSEQIGWQGYLVFPPGTSDPAGAPDGSMYYNTGTGKHRKKNAGVWSNVG